MATNKIPSIDDSLQQQRQLLQEETYQRKVATRYFGTVYCSRSSATTLSTCCSFDHAFTVVSNGNSGKKQKLGRGNARTHHVKPLQILWSKFEERSQYCAVRSCEPSETRPLLETCVHLLVKFLSLRRRVYLEENATATALLREKITYQVRADLCRLSICTNLLQRQFRPRHLRCVALPSCPKVTRDMQDWRRRYGRAPLHAPGDAMLDVGGDN